MDFQSHNNATGNKFVCPSDRQLALRAKLRAGWSSSKSTEPLRPDEQAAIISVIRRNEEIEVAERQRVGKLVERVEKIKQRAVEAGPNCCRLCGDTFGILRSTRIICEDCKKSVCTKCSIDINIRYHTTDRTREIWLCRICSETREMWKKSGAWFFKSLPSYDAPSSTNSTPTRPSAASGGAMSDVLLPPPRNAHSCNSTPTRNVRVKKLTIHVDDDSSSEEEEQVVGELGEGEEAETAGRVHGDVIDGAVNSKAAVSSSPATRTITKTSSQTTTNRNRNAMNAADCKSPTTPSTRAKREDSFRLRTFGSIRNFLDSGERKLSNSLFANRQTARTTEPDYDSISTASTINSVNTRRESNSNYTRRSSVSSSWSLSGESSSGNSAILSSQVLSHHNQVNLHCRELLGWLEVAICYRENVHSLDCTMVRARDLPAMDAAGLTDPYCKLNIITAEGLTKYTRWLRTKTVHKTRNPEFNETLQFVGVEPEELANSYLYVGLFDDDKYGHDFLGATKIGLSAVHNITNQYRISVPLGGEDQYSNEAELAQEWPHGKILISLCYNTKRRALTVNVKQCINLIPMDNNGTSDPFVKLQLKPDSHKNKKYKTAIKWRTLNPIYGEEFHFESSPHDLNKQTLIVTVWDKDIGKSNDFLGSLIIGYNSKGERLQQWLDCIRLPDHFHEKWHCLSGEHPTH